VRGPSSQVTTWQGYDVKGYRFHMKDKDYYYSSVLLLLLYYYYYYLFEVFCMAFAMMNNFELLS
jgi:hypothetical protein